MANQKRALSPPTPPTPLRVRNLPPSSPSAVQSSPLFSGSLISYPVTTASFESSPDLSQNSEVLGSPDYLDPFEYTSDMDADFQRIDATAALLQLEDNAPSSSTESEADSPPPIQPDLPPPQTRIESPSPTPNRKQRTWVVFQGKEPGVYDCVYVFFTQNQVDPHVHVGFIRLLASFQTQGFSGNFQRIYPNRETADAAWLAYMRDGTFPDYGRSPWVIFIGRWVGVTERV